MSIIPANVNLFNYLTSEIKTIDPEVVVVKMKGGRQHCQWKVLIDTDKITPVAHLLERHPTNRPYQLDRVGEIAEAYSRLLNRGKPLRDLHLHAVRDLTIDPNKLYLVDGQHRWEAIREIYFSDNYQLIRNHHVTLDLTISEVSGAPETEELILAINNRVPTTEDSLMKPDETRVDIRRSLEYLTGEMMKAYPKAFAYGGNRAPYINCDRLMASLRNAPWYGTYNGDVREVLQLIEQANCRVSQTSMPFAEEHPANKYGHYYSVARDTGFYLGLNRNYKWMNSIIN